MIGEQQIAFAGRHGVGLTQLLRHFHRVRGMRVQQAEVIAQRFGEIVLVVVGRTADADVVEHEIVGLAAAAPALYGKRLGRDPSRRARR